jgi:hypothetical protein
VGGGAENQKASAKRLKKASISMKETIQHFLAREIAISVTTNPV